MTRSRLASALLLAALSLACPAEALAQGAPPQTEAQAEAQQHFQRAKDLYQQGSYREAIAELEAARVLDPAAKDLVFNLGIVHEKLGKFDEAIGYFRQYLEMESVTPQEKSKAESIIKRIEGAKREVSAATPPDDGSGEPPAGVPPDGEDRGKQPEPAPPHGRIDAATIAAGSVAVVALGVGTFFGIRAVSMRPTDFVTGRDGSYAAFQAKNADAHDAAIVADIGFGVGIVAAVATAWLYFGRTRDPQRTGITLLPGAVAGTFR